MPKKTTTKRGAQPQETVAPAVTPATPSVQMSRELVTINDLGEAFVLAAQDGRRVLDELVEIGDEHLMQHDLLVETWVQKFEGAPDMLKLVVLVRMNPFGRFGELTPAVVYIANSRAYTVLSWSGSFQRDVIGRTLAANRDRAITSGYHVAPLRDDEL